MASDQPTGWQPIETAPREPFEIDVPLDMPEMRRLRMGPEIVLRGEHEGEAFETRACWAVRNDDPGGWWDTEGEEPVDWPMTEWRPLTAEEAAADA